MRWSKRLFDIFWSFIGLILLVPLFIIVAFLIKIEDGGPVFFRQERIGFNGKKFKIWKFRTMVFDAEKKGEQITVSNDPRITKIGRLLRKYKIDELPQLINVLIGDMSLVGPRPEVERYVKLYNEDQKKVLNFVPGITDPASLTFRNENELLSLEKDPEQFYIKEIMPMKIMMNLDYLQKANLWSDFIIIIKTIIAPIIDCLNKSLVKGQHASINKKSDYFNV
ncbi:sugar transferase [Thermosediminibacter litoriperuensis]|uniref:Lipopolysaccharide/colanic/teichoic acid biosynthesis glycosyltransferase n=1 Tax=Thermosediminibacter litoriperuensis TaxID=291989 RepID=A0A5S5ANI4_9FIRM|nr:sugar transferase [Thermosediminibacter litoriperuensis]TYP52405.1 lipopolysaccharide/colanic/teichoic acid biosynthesis glycosyltransferase [Thermosediminibacter litoriperuensis]